MLVIKYFSSSWCGPCKMFGPVVDKVVLETGVNVQKIDVDSNQELVAKYGVTSIPTLIFEQGETIVHKHTGVMSYNQLLKLATSL